MDIFKGQNLLAFIDWFKTDEDCKKYLANIKFQKGYTCRKCGHIGCQERKDFSRLCNICSHIGSASSNTLFHKVKFGLRKAFFMCFEMSTSTKSLSASYMSVRYGVTEHTTRLFMHKVREAMKSSESNPMDGEVKRFYALKIKDFSSKSLKCIFDKHISKQAKVTTDEWRGYRPICKDYDIEQALSQNGMNFKALHTMIHQVKSWIRTAYSWVSEQHINRHLDEFCFRINRSQRKETIFNNLIKRMVVSEKVYQAQIIGN